MTKILLQQIRIEFEQTQLDLPRDKHIAQLCETYSCTTKDLKGYTKWEKQPQNSIDSAIKLVYEELYNPQIEDYLEEDYEARPELVEAEIIDTATKIKEAKPVTVEDLPKPARDGFEGLRLLDGKLQTQALSLLTSIDDMLHNVETAKDVRDLVASHTAIRDSYFNTKAPMVNIINGDVEVGNQNGLATLLNGVEDDC